jgi:hypothetical protein
MAFPQSPDRRDVTVTGVFEKPFSRKDFFLGSKAII